VSPNGNSAVETFEWTIDGLIGQFRSDAKKITMLGLSEQPSIRTQDIFAEMMTRIQALIGSGQHVQVAVDAAIRGVTKEHFFRDAEATREAENSVRRLFENACLLRSLHISAHPARRKLAIREPKPARHAVRV